MNKETLNNLEELLEQMSLSTINILFDESDHHITDWKYCISLDIMNLNFPFLY